ncbi:AAA family ATPase [Nocardia niigatensis]
MLAPEGTRGVPVGIFDVIYLIHTDWDDNFKYATSYRVFYVDSKGVPIPFGITKIGRFGMTEIDRTPRLPLLFEELGDEFFSLGQSEEYYAEIRAYAEIYGYPPSSVFTSLRDVANDLDLFERSIHEDVAQQSLLRFVEPATVRGQFHRIANGGEVLTEYSFGYRLFPPTISDKSDATLDFRVIPESKPPTNIHVLIGRNGVGKTRLLNGMAADLADIGRDTFDLVGSFQWDSDQGEGLFSNVVSVAFSVFDPFKPLVEHRSLFEHISYSYIGLKKLVQEADMLDSVSQPKTYPELIDEFVTSVLHCLVEPRASRWKRALANLESDPIFADSGVSGLFDYRGDPSGAASYADDLFRSLSSGHQIVLLTITRLVETVAEKTLVLLDEPETHLHPPLLSAFIRTLSDLLINRNGVAIIATHSPVVLQEVPQSCVWRLRRSGYRVSADRPSIQTFGENTGTLTNEIFGLEVTQSGYHKLIEQVVSNPNIDYAGAIAVFDRQLGDEAKAIVRSLISLRDMG